MSAQQTSWFTARATLAQIDVLADSIGRLRRHVEGDYTQHLLDRASLAVEALDAILRPTAAEFVRAGLPPAAALAEVDTQARKLRLILCEPVR
jgi:hypothetical protein